MLLVTVSTAVSNKRCIECRHFISNPKYIGMADAEIFGKCAVFPIIQFSSLTKEPMKPDYRYCETARAFPTMCGESAKCFQPLKIWIKMNRNYE